MSKTDFFAENGPIEIVQAFVLLLAVIAFARKYSTLLQEGRKDLLSYSLFLTILPFVGIGRELTFGRVLGLGPDQEYIVTLVFGFVSLFLFSLSAAVFFENVKGHFRSLGKMIFNRSSRSIYLAILVFMVGSVFEHGDFGVPQSQLAEELLELVAYGLILRAALILSPTERARPA